MTGRVRGRLSTLEREWDEKGWRALLTPPRIVLAASLTLVVSYASIDWATLPPPLADYATARARYQPSESWLYDRDGQLLDSARVDFQVRRLAWTPLDQISPIARETIIAAEDKRFRDHGGIDWWSVGGAVRDRLEGKNSRGASTLSMQVAAFLAPDLDRPGSRGIRAKLRQMRAGDALEARWSKDQILEAYLNLAGFRGEAQGIAAAALGLFGKTPAALTRDDALLLAALLPEPGANAERVAQRACALSHDADCTRFTAAAAAMLGPTRGLALDPGLAPHLANMLLTEPGVGYRLMLTESLAT